MSQTPTYGFRYPALSDAPNVPLWVQNLATDVEAKIQAMDASLALISQLPVTIRKPSNQSVTSSTALVNDTSFAWSVAANSVYTMGAYIMATGAQDTGAGEGGLKMQFTGPAGAVGSWTNFGANAAHSPVNDYNIVMESLAAASPRSIGTNAATPVSCAPRGIFVTSGTSGTLQFKWAQNTSNATATVVQANSFMHLTKVA